MRHAMERRRGVPWSAAPTFDVWALSIPSAAAAPQVLTDQTGADFIVGA